MNALLGKWTQLADKFAAQTRRERAIVAGALIFGGSLLIFNFGIDPFLVKARSAVRAETAARTEITQQQTLLGMLELQNADPDAANRARLAAVKKQLLDVSERLVRFEEGMVPPARMQVFLEGLLARNRGIELVGLKTLPVTRVGAAVAALASASNSLAQGAGQETSTQEKGVAGAEEGIYQHGIEIQLAGSYNELLDYLAELERMPQRVMWNSVNFTVDKYPRNIMVLRVYTLSLDKNWLVV